VPNDLIDLISYPSRNYSGDSEGNRETTRSGWPVSRSSDILSSGVIYEVKDCLSLTYCQCINHQKGVLKFHLGKFNKDFSDSYDIKSDVHVQRLLLSVDT
jgi:hypothetical protein